MNLKYKLMVLFACVPLSYGAIETDDKESQNKNETEKITEALHIIEKNKDNVIISKEDMAKMIDAFQVLSLKTVGSFAGMVNPLLSKMYQLIKHITENFVVVMLPDNSLKIYPNNTPIPEKKPTYEEVMNFSQKLIEASSAMREYLLRQS